MPKHSVKINNDCLHSLRNKYKGWDKVRDIRLRFREKVHKLRWFEGVGVNMDEKGWYILVYYHPDTVPDELPDELEGFRIIKKPKLVKSLPKNKTKPKKTKDKNPPGFVRQPKRTKRPKKKV